MNDATLQRFVAWAEETVGGLNIAGIVAQATASSSTRRSASSASTASWWA